MRALLIRLKPCDEKLCQNNETEDVNWESDNKAGAWVWQLILYSVWVHVETFCSICLQMKLLVTFTRQHKWMLFCKRKENAFLKPFSTLCK